MEDSYIINLTSAYDTYTGRLPEEGYEREDQGVPSIIRAIMGRPCRVHYYIQVYELKEIYPENYKNMSFEERRDYLEKWLDKRWNDKEEYLKYFAENQEFPSEKNKEDIVYIIIIIYL